MYARPLPRQQKTSAVPYLIDHVAAQPDHVDDIKDHSRVEDPRETPWQPPNGSTPYLHAVD
jgi:hypothetical protein